jgi:hypothetical protein
MKVHLTTMPAPYVLPADPKQGRPKDVKVDRVSIFKVVKIDELIKWCKDNPDVPADSLALSLESGAFK